MNGRKLGNRYEVLEKIGGGGMAIVYRAKDTLLNRFVSIKVLRAHFSTDDDFVRRFQREAQAAASLSHPNVVNIYDVGIEGEDYYIVMEYIDGLTLKEVIQDRAPLPVSEAIDIAKQICSALGHAHENNIVHRDIKPHNILIGKDGRVKVTDFGIARAITSNTITQDGSVLGSVHYFSPEQARGGITDVKSDIYSLGVVLYEMVTGELPFSGESPISVALKHLQDQFVEPRQLNPNLPQSVENIILKSLAKDPSVRYPSAREMYRDLEKALLYPNVPKFITPPFNDQRTLQMPAVGLRDMEASAPHGEPHNQDNTVVTPPPAAKGGDMHHASTEAAHENAPKKKRKFWRPVIWLAVIFLLLGLGAVTAYTLVTTYMGEEDVKMPDVVGKPYEEALKDISKAGLDINNVTKVEETSDEFDPGLVSKQDQYPGKTIKANREITLTVSKGKEKVEMPNLARMSKEDATKLLTQLGLQAGNVKTVEKESSDDVPGTVIDQDPAAEATIDQSATVTLTIAKQPAKVTLPNLKDLTLDEAKKKLDDVGLKVGAVYNKFDEAVKKDHVIGTNPYAAGDEVQKGGTVDIVLSNGPSPEPEQTGPVKKTVTVNVKHPKPGTEVQVKIVRTDSRGVTDVVPGDNITADKNYQVEVLLEKDTMGSIEVYIDGKKAETIPVPYES
ncbi:MAG TPA: Stk1 family PASTA domain-containing Ser/Thr kinase [Bacilli bacterium]|nr:Stk1 family PASTA domain-containing Ser/Thr kinase [Bacilli bacterium]